jgi:hypothetical protein
MHDQSAIESSLCPAQVIGKLLSARKGQIAHGLFLTSRKPNEKDAVCYRVEYEGEWQEWRE